MLYILSFLSQLKFNHRKTIMVSENITKFKDSLWDGIEDSDEDNENGIIEKYLSSLVSVLVTKGILFHDSNEVIVEGGMKSIIEIFYNFFQSEALLSFLNSLPVDVIDSISQIVYSDDLHEDEVLHELMLLLHKELPLQGDFELVLHYSDIFYSNGVFKNYMEEIISTYRNSFKVQTVDIVTEIEIKNYISIVTKHNSIVQNIVQQILNKSDVFSINDIPDSIDGDLLKSGNIEFLALDKAMYPGENYHTFKSHPAIDIFYNHKINSPHHVEFYTHNNKHFNQFEYFNFIPLIIANMFIFGESLQNFKNRIKDTIDNLDIYDPHFGETVDIESLLDLITILPT